MRLIKGKNTDPEIAIRRMLHAMSFRYRLHDKRLPGQPDIVFGRRRKVIFVHGCFWHRHNCRLGRLPKSKLDFWVPKLEKNIARDRRNERELEAAGWKHFIVWECELKEENLCKRLKKFLDE
jgi:DNA mismatch endonuclease (patch repair protein)